MADEVRLVCSLGRKNFYADNEPKLAYVLMEVIPTDAVNHVNMPLNLSLVLDRSGSMEGEKLDNLKAAVGHVVNSLGPQDLLSVVSFDDASDVLISSQPVTDKSGLQQKVNELQVRGGTEMSWGMRDGLTQLQTGHAVQRVSRMILLTDGQTFGDEEKCRQIAAECQEKGIPLTALGLGSDWNEALLTDLAAKTQVHGGMAAYLNRPEEISTAFGESVKMMQAMVVRNATLTLRLVRGVSPRRVWRVVPLISDLGTNVLSDRDIQVPLGDLERGVGQAILVELQTQPRPLGQVRLAQAEVSYDVPVTGAMGQKVRTDVVVDFVNDAELSRQENPRVMEWVTKSTVHRLKTQALDLEQQGDLAGAARKTKAAATVLLGTGDTVEAAVLQRQTVRLEQGEETSGDYKKEVTMGQATRRLTGKL